VRQTLREGRRAEPRRDEERKLLVVREAAAHAYPTADMNRMLEEIEAGYSESDG
jgi:hypothetical protein